MGTERPVQDSSAGMAPQSSTALPPGCKPAFVKMHGNGSTKETADRRNADTSGLCRHLTASQKAPKVSLRYREDAKARGATSSQLLCQSTDGTTVDGNIEQPLLCSLSHMDMPPADPPANNIASIDPSQKMCTQHFTMKGGLTEPLH